MKFETRAGEFNTAVSSIMAATGRDGIHAHIGVEVINDDLVALTACNGELSLSSMATSREAQGDPITLPAKKLSQILKNLNADAVVKVDYKDHSCVIKSGRSRFKLATMEFDSMPVLVPDDEAIELTLPDLVEGINRTKQSMAKADVRFYLNGLLVQSDGTTTRLVATDGHRMSVFDLGGSSNTVNAIIPNKAVNELAKSLREDSVIRIGKTVLQVVGEFTLTTKLIDGRFPDWTRVMPDNHTVIDISAERLKASVQRVGVLSNDEYHGVRLTFGNNLLTLEANNPDQENATDEIDIEYEGDVVEIGFNAKYLVECLNTVSGACQLKIKDGNTSMLVTDESTARHVVMPMRL